MKIETKKLKSGLRLAVCNMKGLEGVSFKIFVFTGSSNETKECDYGISHLIEHMFFKGTKNRSSFEISKEFDKNGIQTNAYTSKECTCFFTYGTNDSLDKSVEIMSDLFFNSSYDKKELESEKQVVIEEIKMYQDRPDAVCDIMLENIFYDKTTYAHDIAGTEESVSNITREQILDYISKHYLPSNIVLAFAGNVTIKEAEELTQKYFESKFDKNFYEEKIAFPSDFSIDKKQIIVRKDTQQALINIGYKMENRYSSKRYHYSIISQILGGTMSSRLFQEVREKKGLVYNISTFSDLNELTGLFSISLGTTPTKVNLALKTIKGVLDDVVKNGVTLEELNQAKKMIVSALKLSKDSPSNQATKIASQLKYFGKIISTQESIETYQKITLEEVNNTIKELFENKNYCICMVNDKLDIDLIEAFEK